MQEYWIHVPAGKTDSNVEEFLRRVNLEQGAGRVQCLRHSPTTKSGPGSIPRLYAICGVSLVLAIFATPKGFSPGAPGFPSSQIPIWSGYSGR